MDFHQVSPEDFFRMLNEKMSGHNDNIKYDMFGPLSPDDAEEWSRINADDAKLRTEAVAMKAKIDIVESRRKLFWCKIEENIGIYDKNMQIRGTDLYIEKDKSPGESDDDEDDDRTFRRG